MRLPRVRFTVRRMMMVVVLAALVLGAFAAVERRRERFRSLARYYYLKGREQGGPPFTDDDFAKDPLLQAKLHAAQSAWDAADRAVQIFGGRGWSTLYRPGRHLMDVRVVEVAVVSGDGVRGGLQLRHRPARRASPHHAIGAIDPRRSIQHSAADAVPAGHRSTIRRDLRSRADQRSRGVRRDQRRPRNASRLPSADERRRG